MFIKDRGREDFSHGGRPWHSLGHRGATQEGGSQRMHSQGEGGVKETVSKGEEASRGWRAGRFQKEGR